MISTQSLVLRRQRLTSAVRQPIVLMGHTRLPRNYPANVLPFRQDSTFLYYTGCAIPGAVAVLTEEAGFELFLPEPDEDDAMWFGELPDQDEVRTACGADRIRPRHEASGRIEALLRAGSVHSVPVADPAALAELRAWTGQHLVCGAMDAASGGGSEALLDEVIRQRLVKDSEELEEIRSAVAITRSAHLQALELCAPGASERQIATRMLATFHEAGYAEAYPPIVTVRGEVLHSEDYGHRLAPGQLLLLDAGSEAPSGYASDVTRTFPVSGRLDPFQRDVYDVVLRAQTAAIEMSRPGVRYLDIHLEASRVIAEGLVDLGLLHGKPEDLVESGAHAMFFPHGIGHLMGLDVHDMEGHWDRAGYAPGRKRSEQFGLCYLRLDRDLAPGMVVTIEPGIYFVPAILGRRRFRERFAGQVDFERAERHLGFGGIRIEDDVAVTDDAPEVLSAAIPKAIEQIERRA